MNPNLLVSYRKYTILACSLHDGLNYVHCLIIVCGSAPWEACAYDATLEGDFINNHLGPILKRDHPDVKLLMFDHNKDHAVHWAKDILGESNPSSQYVDGTAIHWYAGGMDRLLDGAGKLIWDIHYYARVDEKSILIIRLFFLFFVVGAANMHRLMSTLKQLNVSDDHLVLGTEACHCPTTGYSGGDLKVAWDRAERYAHTILSDLAAGSNGWVEWNLV